MVKSKLIPNINYPEIKNIDKNDINFDAVLYEANVLGLNTLISIGQSNYSFSKDNIIYFPIYLIKDNKVLSQIGVYEIFENNLPSILDDDGDPDLNKLDNPLLFSFVTKSLLQNAIYKPTPVTSIKPSVSKKSAPKLQLPSPESDTDTESDSDTPEEPKESQKMLQKINIPSQTLEEAIIENKQYKFIKGEPWIQSYYQNNYFKILDNEGGGDCFFAVVRDALKSIQIDTTVTELRRKVSENVTKDVFDTYLERYKLFSDSIKADQEAIKLIVKNNNELREKIQLATSKQEKIAIKLQSDENVKEHAKLKENVSITKTYLEEVAFMKEVKSVEMLKDFILTSRYWADEWSISTLEFILNIKMIILSRDLYEENKRETFEKSNIVLCGHLFKPPKKDNTSGVTSKKDEDFNPDYYIMTELGGKHYKLITYRDSSCLTFIEIPYYTKLQVVNRCLERLSGSYSLIPQFRRLNEELGVGEKVKETEIDEQIVDINPSMNPLYNPQAVLQYSSTSLPKIFPGEGQGEIIEPSEKTSFIPLAGGGSGNWRQMISNEWTQPFTLDGHRWLSVEHYFQANKFKNENPEFYLLFTMDSPKKSKYYDDTSLLSQISNDVEIAKLAGNKNPKRKIEGKIELLRPEQVKIDADFYNGRNSKILEDATYAKFSQNDDLAHILDLTKNAKLVSYMKGKPPLLSHHLMKTRAKLRVSKTK